VTDLNPPSGLRLVALDIDDTLIPWRGGLATETIAAVQAVRAAGIEVVLASGRGITDVAHLSHELGIDEFWALCSNGSVTARVTRGDFVIVKRVTFDPRGIVAALRELDPTAPVAIESSGIGFLVDGDPFDGQAPHVAGPLGPMPEQVTFLSIASAALSEAQLLETTLAAPVRAVPYPHDGWVTIDIVAVDAGKGAALAALALEHGFQPQHCAAVGDYLNDIPMLEWAGWAVAMGQAPAQVRAVADAVVAPVTEHGAAQALLAIVANPA
jgi:HAD superfamily hydrolase (TIGR01484 family)